MKNLTNPEKRALEIFITLVSQHIRKNNDKALKDLRAFFYGLAYTKTYDPELLYTQCIENIEIFEKIPNHYEIALTLLLVSQNVTFNGSSFKPYYMRTLTAFKARQAGFSEQRIELYPRIKNANFHCHLLTFLQEFAKIGRRLPIPRRLK